MRPLGSANKRRKQGSDLGKGQLLNSWTEIEQSLF